MIFYLVFNGGLYLTQVVLYASLFLLDRHGIFEEDGQGKLTLVRGVCSPGFGKSVDDTN